MFELFKNGVCSPILIEEEAFSGVRKIAGKVTGDINLVTNACPAIYNSAKEAKKAQNDFLIIAGTIGKSAIVDNCELEEVKKIAGKRECYAFLIVDGNKVGFDGVKKILLIAGSDKRGTIYGLFHISELMGVSPWVAFSDVVPARRDEVVFDEKSNYISKEPSVKYRGLFINDEWPAFGNWTFKHFGGFTAKMYDLIFETILRLKGNYLWPAMWTSSFTLDGPGEDNAILADEYGIVMSNSHHEPCLRHSEEWDKVKGDDTIYGKDWNYYINKEGLLNYWRDGLLRSGKYENIITIGMRGERDSSMLGEDSTLTQNIDLLKDIITNQRRLIGECVANGGKDAPQMIALYKEVEAYFYGNPGKHDGLRDWDGLDGVTFMLCEDNFGNMRTLPTEDLRNRKGGWGMYYHFDYHGGPISYEWVNSSYLPKVWDQMTKAYEFGIRDIWIVNVGDFKFNEYPLSFFMDLAYDYDKWGVNNLNAPDEYLKLWVKREFGNCLNNQDQIKLMDVMKGYTKLAHNRKCEAFRTDTYHPFHYNEANRILDQIKELEVKLDELLSKLSGEYIPQYYELVYYPAMGTLNVQKWNIYAGLNNALAGYGAVYANHFLPLIDECKEKDEKLTKTMHSLLNGKWDGMGLSKHVGFTNWNDEECKYPVKVMVTPADGMRLLAYSKDDGDVVSAGGDWTGRIIRMKSFNRPDRDKATLGLLNAGNVIAKYEIVNKHDGISFSKMSGEVNEIDEIIVTVDKKTYLAANEGKTFEPDFIVKYDRSNIKVKLSVCEETKVDEMTFIENDGIVSIEAEHYAQASAGDSEFRKIPEYGKTLSGMKAFPITEDFNEDAPYLTYKVFVKDPGEYKLDLYVAPVNPHYAGVDVTSKVSVNGKSENVSFIPDNFRAGEPSCPSWCVMVLDQIRVASVKVTLNAGVNEIRYSAVNPGVVLEKLVLIKDGVQILHSYLGPVESYYKK